MHKVVAIKNNEESLLQLAPGTPNRYDFCIYQQRTSTQEERLLCHNVIEIMVSSRKKPQGMFGCKMATSPELIIKDRRSGDRLNARFRHISFDDHPSKTIKISFENFSVNVTGTLCSRNGKSMIDVSVLAVKDAPKSCVGLKAKIYPSVEENISSRLVSIKKIFKWSG